MEAKLKAEHEAKLQQIIMTGELDKWRVIYNFIKYEEEQAKVINRIKLKKVNNEALIFQT